MTSLKQASQFTMPQADLTGKSILVTGATGSFGRHFVRVVLERFNPRRVIVFSRDEFKQFEMRSEISEDRFPQIRYFLGDVRDRDRLELALNGVDIVIHAAALKHIPAAEYNPFECIHTNVIGAENIVRAANRTGVKRVIALSTDKAANPVNLYGASKLASDKIFVAAGNLTGGGGPLYSVVRYGNVIGSRGSIIPLFRKLIRDGAKDLPITDARMTRFWITLEQGVNFVLSSLEMMRGGEIFVPKIPSMRVTDLAEVLGPGLPHRVIGIRPGEKLHESMITEADARTTVDLGDRYVIEPSLAYWQRSSFHGEGTEPVGEEFSYSSNTNTEWLDQTDLQRLLEQAKV
ncbi:MAG: UDP-N-acetylglucosamine 4,6-dehydratase (inverting) [Proteobacteria bacterium]|nr:UDP-N-acetylglucosamine 4,6-dehydratase (inverting) [Pseudomonadota bacterium]